MFFDSAPTYPIPDGYTPDEWERIRILPPDVRTAVILSRLAIRQSQALLDQSRNWVEPPPQRDSGRGPVGCQNGSVVAGAVSGG